MRWCTSVQAASAALPQGPSLRSGLCCPGPSSLNRPHAPHSQAHLDFTDCGLYEMPSLCVYLQRLGDPRVVPCFRWLFSIDMSSSETPGSSSAACTQFLHRRRWPSTCRNGLGTSHAPTLRFSWGVRFRGLTTVRFRYDLSICSPPCRSRPGFHPANGDFYFRAFDGLVTRTAAGYHYSGNWASSTGGIFTR